jgi:AbrB family looped-hinge helix DNA binding protein
MMAEERSRRCGLPKVTVSPKFQVVIPLEVRESLGIHPGEMLQVFQYENRIEMIPVRPMREMRGFLRGIDTTVDREPDRL